jgi:hypothetical protein
MILGMTRAELGLTVFIFALIYGAGFLTRLGKAIGGLVAGRESTPPPEGPSSDLPGSGDGR